jgi:HemX protein
MDTADAFPILVLKGLLPVAYLAALVAYGRTFFSERARENESGAGPKTGLMGVLLVHSALLIAIALRFQRVPLWTLGEALLFLGWMLAVLHLLSEWSAETRRLGLFTLAPAAACALPALFFLGDPIALPPDYLGAWFIFHIVASLASYAAFSLAAVLALLYLIQHRNLKQKHFTLTFRNLPPLDKLDRLAATWAFMGTLLMIASSVIGAWWVRRDSLRGMTPSEAGIFAVLAIFLGAAIARRALGWRGKRHARWILLGFAALVIANSVLHGFFRY